MHNYVSFLPLLHSVVRAAGRRQLGLISAWAFAGQMLNVIKCQGRQIRMISEKLGKAGNHAVRPQKRRM